MGTLRPCFLSHLPLPALLELSECHAPAVSVCFPKMNTQCGLQEFRWSPLPQGRVPRGSQRREGLLRSQWQRGDAGSADASHGDDRVPTGPECSQRGSADLPRHVASKCTLGQSYVSNLSRRIVG